MLAPLKFASMRNAIPFLVLVTFGAVGTLRGQFTQVELFKSLDRTAFSLYSSLQLNEVGSLRLATLAFFETYRSTEHKGFNEVGVQPTLFWDFNKRFSLGPSVYYNSISGVAHRLSAQYSAKSERCLIVVIPTIGHYQQTKVLYGEVFAQVQLSIPIKKATAFWANGQFLYVWDAFKSHSRSYQRLRTGISHKRHQIGLGLDLEYYTLDVVSTNSIGLYYRGML